LKPERFVEPLPRSLTSDERAMLHASAAGGAHPVRPAGLAQWRTARRLATLGLGAIDGKTFTASPAGVVAVAGDR
jgi:hypothetical protein